MCSLQHHLLTGNIVRLSVRVSRVWLSKVRVRVRVNITDSILQEQFL